ncbi:type II toxin-antitoxin system VapC family toxin [Leptospira wolffii]|uniref:PIN domain nuclease n=1 Tax=Leptospira wolffii TaxID=409998 RepID=A0A2M9ZH89_9LEPT|nr:type II toxin-antitoxin system VapC family toxin [Leptospira wolffii]PJZ67744.1 PIN domain nuclease [Leptospira wolffii]TGK62752.1 type II toxin-antitoxin system VapC family toxin [Leptospira wolffii]TGK73861.1 type II toxin-antitoxin system VapC family toxin [Leptospira wolffii]TGK75016.1 type II toxin-antitoxin system VapC family toxin [Leptospira wolffii]TGL28723.1 type II toxin-antitoxin system VapC family toxin [Leptospira wolffii]
MNYLLDTHAILWALFEPKNLSFLVAREILNDQNRIFISNISLWEISLKFALRKLELKGITPDRLPNALREAGFEFVNDSPEIFSNYYKLPLQNHTDPFDRFLIWQAVVCDFVFITKDRYLEEYDPFGLKTLW